MKQPVKVDFFSSQFKEESFPIYSKLREDYPIYPVKMPNGLQGWVITRYQDCMAALKNPLLFNNGKAVLGEKEYKKRYPGFRGTDRVLLQLDPPDHTKLRKIISKAFWPRTINAMESQIQASVEELLDQVSQKREAEFMEEFAYPLPINVICDLIGIPREDRHKFQKWSVALTDAANNPKRMLLVLPKMLSFYRYLQKLVKKTRKNPTDNLVSRLISHAEEQNTEFTEEDLYSMLFLLILAGHETTVNLLGSMMLALFDNPDQLTLLKQQPELTETAVEEALRYYSPVELALARFVSEDTVILDQKVQKTDNVIVALASANHDATVFQNPEVFDITREQNLHLSFGHGIHYCIGASLARLEMKLVIPMLLERMPNIRLAVPRDHLKWRASFQIRGLESLPVKF